MFQNDLVFHTNTFSTPLNSTDSPMSFKFFSFSVSYTKKDPTNTSGDTVHERWLAIPSAESNTKTKLVLNLDVLGRNPNNKSSNLWQKIAF